MNSTPESRAEQIRATITAHVAALLDGNYDAIVKAAEQTFKQDDAAGEIEAKVAFAVTFLPAVQSPKVSVKASWSVRYSDETAEEINPAQAKLPLADDGATVTIKTEGCAPVTMPIETFGKLAQDRKDGSSSLWLKQAKARAKEMGA